MTMLPVLPPYADETTVSWCARVAHFHTGLNCSDFLKMTEISQANVMDLSDEAVKRLSNLTGVSETQILGCGPQKAGERLLTYKGEVFGSRFMTRTYTSYCPACLLDDAIKEANGNRVGRLSWMLAPVRVCPIHRIILTRRKNSGYSGRFQNMNEVAPSDQELVAQVAVAEAAIVSPLQSYVVDRFTAGKGSAWMDAQQIDQAARACEMLGIYRILGAHTDIGNLTIQQWNDAGSIGIEAVSRGSEGICQLLEEIVQEATDKKSQGGPQSALGGVYKWLQYSKSNQDPGPVKNVVRNFILDHMPVEPGTVLFGNTVLHRKRHNVATLSRVSGVHRKTLNRALVLTGLLAGGNPEDIENRRTFNASEGEALAHRVKNSTPIKKIPEYLNCNRTQAQMMVKNGILNKVGNDPSIQGGLLSNVANEDLDDFLVKFRAAGRQVAVASSNMIDVNAASELARIPVADIVALVLAGKLSKVETGCGSLRFRSVFVDAAEVRLAAAGVVAEHGLTPKEAASRIGLKLMAIEHLRNSCDANGQPFLRGTKLANARGTVRYCYTEKEVNRFREEYITLKELADLHGIGTKQMAKKMATEGVEPIMARSLLRAKVFRRKGI